MNSEIKVSIITPSFNQGNFIEATIRSVINQTYKNIQFILIDGGSTDNTMEIVNSYKKYFDVIIHEKDNGQSDAINKGFKLSKGELVGWLNSDDILYPNCVEKIVELYNKKKDGSIYYNSTIDIIDAQGKLIKKYTNNITDKNYLLKEYYSVCQQGSFYSSEALKKVNYINEDIHYCMDLDLWLRLLNYGPIYSIGNESFAALREWETTKTATGGSKFLKEIRSTLLKHGAGFWHKTIRRTYWYQLKFMAKDLLKVK